MPFLAAELRVPFKCQPSQGTVSQKQAYTDDFHHFMLHMLSSEQRPIPQHRDLHVPPHIPVALTARKVPVRPGPRLARPGSSQGRSGNGLIDGDSE